MKNFTVSQAIRFIVIFMFSVGLISASIQERKCNTGRCSHVSGIDVKKKMVKSVRPLFEKIFII